MNGNKYFKTMFENFSKRTILDKTKRNVFLSATRVIILLQQPANKSLFMSSFMNQSSRKITSKCFEKPT